MPVNIVLHHIMVATVAPPWQAITPQGSRQLQNDAVAVYKSILRSIADLEKVYLRGYGDNL